MTIQETVNAISHKQPFFTQIVKGLKPVEEKDVPTLGTDGDNLYYNPDFFDKLTDSEKCAVVLHETLHCAFFHMWRKDKREQMRWNMATDYAINPMVDENFKLPEGGLLDSKYYGMSAEQIYDALAKNKTKNQKQKWCDKGHWGDQGKGNGSGQQNQKQGQGKNKKGKGGSGSLMDKMKKAFGIGDKDGGKALKEALGIGKEGRLKKKEEEWAKNLNSQRVKEKWKRIFNEKIVKEYGNAPASIKRVIEKSYYIPTVDWASLVASILSEDTSDYSFARPDRRYSGMDVVLPGMYSIDNLKDVVFAYDTSGSITDEDLKSYYHETLSLFQNFTNLKGWIGVCDADLHFFGEIEQQSKFEDFHFFGGGGTDFNPVFNKIKEKGLKPKALFYFTDTYGSFPPEEPPYPVFWLVRSYIGDNSTLNVPFGTVIKFMDKISRKR